MTDRYRIDLGMFGRTWHLGEVFSICMLYSVDAATAERFLRLKAQPVDARGFDYYGMPAIDPHAMLAAARYQPEAFDGLGALLSGKGRP